MNEAIDDRRHHRSALGLVVLVAAAVHAWIAGWDAWTSTFSDSIDYLFMADFYRALLYGGELEAARAHYETTRFPPLFPFLLGAAGAGSWHAHAAAIVSNAIAVGAVVAVWYWVRAESGRVLVATAVSLALVTFPWFFVLNLTPVSEPLGILLCASAFALAEQQPTSRSRLLAAALVIGLAPLARSALLPLCIAFPLWLAFRRDTRWEQAWPAVLVAWLPFAAWTAYRALLGSHSYLAQLTPAQYSQAGMDSWTGLLQSPLRLFEAFTYAWGRPDPLPWTSLLAVLFTVLATVGCGIRLRQNRLDAWFLAGYVALILLWPFPSEHTRFIVAAYPFMLVSVYSALEWLVRRFAPRAGRWPVVALAALVLLLSAPAWARFAHRAALPVDAELLGEKREPFFFLLPADREALAMAEINARARLLLQEADRQLPAEACLYASPPQFARLYARRRVINYPAGLGLDTGDADRRLGACDYFFIGAWESRVYGIPPGYPERSLQGWTEPLLVSRMRYGEREITAATLSRRRNASSAVSAGTTHSPADDP